jgi:hypothetical protein
MKVVSDMELEAVLLRKARSSRRKNWNMESGMRDRDIIISISTLKLVGAFQMLDERTLWAII